MVNRLSDEFYIQKNNFSIFIEHCYLDSRYKNKKIPYGLLFNSKVKINKKYSGIEIPEKIFFKKI